MWGIVKGEEPGCLPKLRAELGADWGNVYGDQKEEMRKALCRDQGFVCAYCQSRIAPREDGEGPLARVEHWETRALNPARVFDWRNLLGVCQGDVVTESEAPPPMPGHPETGQVHARLHCDNHRGSLPPEGQALHLCLTHPVAAGRVRFSGAGQVWSDDPDVQADIVILNLNIWRLVANRRAAVDHVARVAGDPPRASELRKLLERVERRDDDGRFAEYAAAMAYIARRLLHRAEARARG
ncbi:MAG: hypothetical protein ABIO70_10355 [Pseudomonadota bacterium]